MGHTKHTLTPKGAPPRTREESDPGEQRTTSSHDGETRKDAKHLVPDPWLIKNTVHSIQLGAGSCFPTSESLMCVYTSVNQRRGGRSALYLLSTCSAIKRLLIQARRRKARDFSCEASIIQECIHYSKFFLKSYCQLERKKKMRF